MEAHMLLISASTLSGSRGVECGCAGGALLHVDQVQVHPTGFVDPRDPNNKSKVGSPTGWHHQGWKSLL